MKKLIMIFFTALLVSCNTSPKEKPEGFTTISIEKTEDLMKNNSDLIILDVRTPEEIELGKIEGAVEINFSQPSFKEDILSLDKEKTILIYCAVGGRSKKTMDLMKNLNFREVYNLEGGIEAWKSANKPLAK